MIDIAIDEAAWKAKGVTFERKGGVYRFMLDGRSDVCVALITSDKLNLFPERSAEHKALLAALGQDISPPAGDGFGSGGFGVNVG